jgi:hypothetical protein
VGAGCVWGVAVLAGHVQALVLRCVRAGRLRPAVLRRALGSTDLLGAGPAAAAEEEECGRTPAPPPLLDASYTQSWLDLAMALAELADAEEGQGGGGGGGGGGGRGGRVVAVIATLYAALFCGGGGGSEAQLADVRAEVLGTVLRACILPPSPALLRRRRGRPAAAGDAATAADGSGVVEGGAGAADGGMIISVGAEAASVALLELARHPLAAPLLASQHAPLLEEVRPRPPARPPASPPARAGALSRACLACVRVRVVCGRLLLPWLGDTETSRGVGGRSVHGRGG